MAAIEEWAAWSSWRGSPSLVRHIIDKIVQAVGDDAQPTVIVTVFDDDEVFGSAAAFTSGVTADALRDFHRITVRVDDPELSAKLVFARDRWSAPKPRYPSEVRLTVEAPSAQQATRVLTVTRVACKAVRRGHRDWIGQTAGSAGVERSWRGNSFNWPPYSAQVGRLLIGAAFTLLVLSTIAMLFPTHQPSGTLRFSIAAVASLVSVRCLGELIPSIEIAEPGKTRLDGVRRWGVPAVAALVVAQLAKRIFGS